MHTDVLDMLHHLPYKHNVFLCIFTARLFFMVKVEYYAIYCYMLWKFWFSFSKGASMNLFRWLIWPYICFVLQLLQYLIVLVSSVEFPSPRLCSGTNSMSGQCSNEGSSTGNIPAEGSDSTVQLNIKTLDSRIYSFQVEKNVSCNLYSCHSCVFSSPILALKLVFKIISDACFFVQRENCKWNRSSS